jgi:hypothetical protein
MNGANRPFSERLNLAGEFEVSTRTIDLEDHL